MEITWKNVLPIPVSWNTPEVLKSRAEFVAQNLLPFSTKNYIYVDETGFNLRTKKSKGWALSGHPATLSVLPKGKNITVIGALSREGLIHYRIVQSLRERRGTTAEDFRSFLLDLLGKIPSGSIIVMDNAKIHHAEILQTLLELIRNAHKSEIVFLPPYSPFLNPIEYAFNDLKQSLKPLAIKNKGELIESIKEKIPLINNEKAKGYFQQVSKYYQQCLMGIAFHGKPLVPELNLDDNSSFQITNSSSQMISNS